MKAAWCYSAKLRHQREERRTKWLLVPRGDYNIWPKDKISSAILGERAKSGGNTSSDCDKISPRWDRTKWDVTTEEDWRCEPGCTIILTSSQLLNWQALDGDCQSTQLSQRKDSQLVPPPCCCGSGCCCWEQPWKINNKNISPPLQITEKKTKLFTFLLLLRSPCSSWTSTCPTCQL